MEVAVEAVSQVELSVEVVAAEEEVSAVVAGP